MDPFGENIIGRWRNTLKEGQQCEAMMHIVSLSTFLNNRATGDLTRISAYVTPP